VIIESYIWYDGDYDGQMMMMTTVLVMLDYIHYDDDDDDDYGSGDVGGCAGWWRWLW